MSVGSTVANSLRRKPGCRFAQSSLTIRPMRLPAAYSARRRTSFVTCLIGDRTGSTFSIVRWPMTRRTFDTCRRADRELLQRHLLEPRASADAFFGYSNSLEVTHA